MNNKFSNRIFKQSFTSNLFFTAVFLIAAIISNNGIILFSLFCLFSLFIILIHKRLEPLIIWYFCLMINNSLIEYPLLSADSFTLTAVIDVIIMVAFVAEFLRFRKKRYTFKPTYFILWTIYFLINAVLNKNNILDVLYHTCFPFVACIYAQMIISRNAKNGLLLMGALVAGTVILSGFGYVELIANKTFFYSNWTGAERYRYGILRVGSTVADPNFLCLSELFLFCILSSNVFINYIGKRKAKWLLVFIALSIILTFSRTGIIALIASIVLIYSKGNRKVIVCITPIIALLLSLVINSIFDSMIGLDISSYDSRTTVVAIAMKMWHKSPIVGNGNNSFYQSSFRLLGTEIDTMNEYVHELVNFGVIGLGFYITYFILLLKRTCKSFFNLFNNYLNSIYYFSAILSWLIMSYTLDTYSVILIWLLPAIFMSIEIGGKLYEK